MAETRKGTFTGRSSHRSHVTPRHNPMSSRRHHDALPSARPKSVGAMIEDEPKWGRRSRMATPASSELYYLDQFEIKALKDNASKTKAKDQAPWPAPGMKG